MELDSQEYPGSEAPAIIEALSFAYQSARSLLHNLPDRVGVQFRPIYEANADSLEEPPLNTAENVLSGVREVLAERNPAPLTSYRPYWQPDLVYDTLEVFGAAVQSLDLHDAPLPRTVLPPSQDVANFIDAIRQRPDRVLIPDQFTLAMDIADNNTLGAVNLCWIGSRFMARGADQRAYPDIPIDAVAVREWNTQLAQFQTFDNSGKNDAPGDTYYFWTHAFGAMAFSQNGLRSALAQAAFSQGTSIMAFVRKHVATGNQPNITAHEPASTIGRQVGLLLAARR